MPSNSNERRRFLTDALRALGWYGKDLASRLGTSAGAVSSWRTGRRPTPSYALAYIDLARGITEALAGPADALKPLAGER